MYKFWPSPALFVFAAILFFKGGNLHDEAQKKLSEVQTYRLGGQVYQLGRGTADQDLVTARYMQTGGGVLAVIGVVLLGLGVAHGQVQSQTLNRTPGC